MNEDDNPKEINARTSIRMNVPTEDNADDVVVLSILKQLLHIFSFLKHKKSHMRAINEKRKTGVPC